MELLQLMAQGVQLQVEAAVRRAEQDKDVKLPKLAESDDIVAYLTTFERVMKANEIKEEQWVFNPLTANDALPKYPSTAEAVNAVT